MKFFLAQINPVVGDLEGNAIKILKVSAQACLDNADLVLTPELSLWGYPAKDLLLKRNLIEKQYQILDKFLTFLHLLFYQAMNSIFDLKLILFH